MYWVFGGVYKKQQQQKHTALLKELFWRLFRPKAGEDSYLRSFKEFIINTTLFHINTFII